MSIGTDRALREAEEEVSKLVRLYGLGDPRTVAANRRRYDLAQEVKRNDYAERCRDVAEELLMRFEDLGGDLTSEDELGMPFVGGASFGLSLNSSGSELLVVTPGDDPFALWPYEIVRDDPRTNSSGVLDLSWDKWDEIQALPPAAFRFSGVAVRYLDELLQDLGFGV